MVYRSLFSIYRWNDQKCDWIVKFNRRKIGAEFLLGKLKESECFEDLDIEKRIILRWVFKN